MICFHVPFTLPYTINLAILLVVKSESDSKSVNSLALFLSLASAEEKVGARRTMGVKVRHYQKKPSLCFKNRLLDLCPADESSRLGEEERLLHKHHGVWISRGHPGQEYIPKRRKNNTVITA